MTVAGGVLVLLLWYLSNRIMHWAQDGYLAAVGFAPLGEEILHFPSYGAIGQIPIAIVLAGVLVAALTASKTSRQRGTWVIAVSVVVLVGATMALAVVTRQAGLLARTCASGWQRTVVETSVSLPIRCVDQNFRPQENSGHARDHQRYQLGGEEVYIHIG